MKTVTVEAKVTLTLKMDETASFDEVVRNLEIEVRDRTTQADVEDVVLSEIVCTDSR